MTKIVLPAKTPEHLATETALHVALGKMERAERENHVWRVIAVACLLALCVIEIIAAMLS